MGNGKESAFNEAALKMQRIHASQEVINTLRTNMLAWNIHCSKYNYEVVISELLTLLSETRGKLGTDELTKYARWRTIITSAIDSMVIHATIQDASFGSEKGRKVLQTENWNMLRKMIFELEDFAKDMLEGHGYSSPNTEEEAGWD